jgi:hypothetical protein
VPIAVEKAGLQFDDGRGENTPMRKQSRCRRSRCRTLGSTGIWSWSSRLDFKMNPVAPALK